MKASTPRAFTLIEILAVIAILAVLTILLFPALNIARDSSRAAKTVSNMRSIVAAMRLDAVDNAGRITLRGPVWLWDFYNVHLYRKGYLPMEAFSDSWVEPKHDDRWRRDEGNRFSAYGYGVRFLNGWEGLYHAVEGPSGQIANADEMWASIPATFNPAAVEKPSEFWILGDSLDQAEKWQKIYMSGNPTDPWTGRFHLRHRGKAHAAFLDGHVELCDKARLKEIGVQRVVNADGVEETL